MDETQNGRAGPRAVASLEVEVEVAGEKQRVTLVSQDIGSGGMFLRTDTPAPLWKRVKMTIGLPSGEPFVVGGEVVRCVSAEQSLASGQHAGMAVAFDEISRTKRKALIALVLELCARRPTKAERPEGQKAEAQKAGAKASSKPGSSQFAKASPRVSERDKEFEAKTDELLGQLDALLESVEKETNEKPVRKPSQPTAKAAAPMAQPKAPIPQAGPQKPAAAATSAPAEDPQRVLRQALLAYKKSCTGTTHYQVLEVERNATPVDIKNAYGQLLKRLSPPSGQEVLSPDLQKELAGVLERIRKAFAILAKPDRRQAYDFLIASDSSDDA